MFIDKSLRIAFGKFAKIAFMQAKTSLKGLNFVRKYLKSTLNALNSQVFNLPKATANLASKFTKALVFVR